MYIINQKQPFYPSVAHVETTPEALAIRTMDKIIIGYIDADFRLLKLLKQK